MNLVVALDASATSDGRRFAGIGRYADELIAALRQLNGLVDIEVAAPRRPPRSERWPYRYARGQPPLGRTAHRTHPDVVHGLASEAALCFPLRRQIVTVHDAVPWTGRAGPFDRAYLELQRRLLRRVAAVIVPSQAAVTEVASGLDIPPERITAIPHGVSGVFSSEPGEVDAAVRARAGLTRDPYVLWVGSLHGPDPRKGLDVLIDALASLEAGSRPMVGLVGKPGSGSSWARERCCRQGIEAVLPGYVEDRDLAALYRGAAAAVMPSRHEGFGLPALEAMACGTPLIVSDAGSLPSVVDEAGLVVGSGDAGALAEAIRALLVDLAQQARLRAAGPQRAGAFSWEAAARRTVEIYEQVRASRSYGARA